MSSLARRKFVYFFRWDVRIDAFVSKFASALKEEFAILYRLLSRLFADRGVRMYSRRS